MSRRQLVFMLIGRITIKVTLITRCGNCRLLGSSSTDCDLSCHCCLFLIVRIRRGLGFLSIIRCHRLCYRDYLYGLLTHAFLSLGWRIGAWVTLKRHGSLHNCTSSCQVSNDVSLACLEICVCPIFNKLLPHLQQDPVLVTVSIFDARKRPSIMALKV